MPRAEMPNRSEITEVEIIPVNDKFIVTWWQIDTNEQFGEVFDTEREARRFAVRLDPMRAVGIERFKLSHGMPIFYEDLRDANAAMRELEDELRTEPTLRERLRVVKALSDLQAAVRETEREERPMYEPRWGGR